MTWRRRSPGVFAVAVLIAVLAASCSGGGTSRAAVQKRNSTTTSAAVTTVPETSTSTTTTSSPPATTTTSPAPAPEAAVLFSRAADAATGTYVVAASGGTAHRVIAGPGDPPDWAPDHRHLVGVTGNQVVVVAADGSGLRTLATAPDAPTSPPTASGVAAVAWSPDGANVAYATAGPAPTDPAGVWVVPAAGGTPRQLAAISASGVSWSPRSDALAVAGASGLTVVPLDGAPRTLASGTFDSVSWSSRDRLAYAGGGTLHVVGADGAGDHVVAEGSSPDWSPDGATLAYSGNVGNETAIILAGPDGEASHAVTPPEQHARTPNWSPDGRSLAVTELEGSASRIYRIAPDGSHRVALTDGPSDESAVW